MKYFRIKEEFDNYRYFPLDKQGNRKKIMVFVVGNELYTEAEYRQLGIPERFGEFIDILKTKTYWSFGCRFSL